MEFMHKFGDVVHHTKKRFMWAIGHRRNALGRGG